MGGRTSEGTTADWAGYNDGITSLRRLEYDVKKYNPESSPKLFHALQSQAAHAGVSARLRRKSDVLTGKAPAVQKAESATLSLFPEDVRVASWEAAPVAVCA